MDLEPPYLPSRLGIPLDSGQKGYAIIPCSSEKSSSAVIIPKKSVDPQQTQETRALHRRPPEPLCVSPARGTSESWCQCTSSDAIPQARNPSR